MSNYCFLAAVMWSSFCFSFMYTV